MRSLTIKQPWASLICTPSADDPTKGIKPIENRTWKTNFRGRIYIHAGSQKKFNIQLTDDQTKAAIPVLKTAFDDTMHFGAIIGEVDIVDCVINHPSIWAEKTDTIPTDVYNISNGLPAYLGKGNKEVIYNWVLANPVLYEEPILNVKGKLSFWEFNK